MKKRIFIMGQCTLHWGRMEFGNIGNYYIVKPMFEQLRRVFEQDEIVTTMQFSREFCEKFQVQTVPMEWYYDFTSEENLSIAQEEYLAVKENCQTDSLYVREIKKADLVIDFSGDIWGDNADFLGKDRFMVGLYKDLTAQLLKPTVMIAGSPGPFENQKDLDIIKKVYKGFDLVTNREHISTRLLYEQGFDIENTKDYACPSFLFKPAVQETVKAKIHDDSCFATEKIKVGIMLCGWNFEKGPFDLWPRDNTEYNNFAEMIQHLVKKYDVQVYLLSHSNGFAVPPEPFVLKHGRDYPIMEQFSKILNERKLNVKLFEGIYSPEETKGIISNFDVLISGRMHGAVAGISQCIPTVIIDYGHEPKAHKLKGFAEIAGLTEYIVDPNNLDDMIRKTELCMENRKDIQDMLKKRMLQIEESAKEQFDLLNSFVEE